MTTGSKSNLGKFPRHFLETSVFPLLGANRTDVLVAPGIGLDNGVIDVGSDLALVVTTDPFFYIPQHGVLDAAWHAWHITGSDIATCGFPPTHVVLNFTLPLSMEDEEFQSIMQICSQEAERFGASIIAGHSGRYEGAQYPFIGSAVFLSLCPADEYITSAMAQPGDVVIVTKGAPISAVGMLARTYPEQVRKRVGAEAWTLAYDYIRKSSSMDDSLIAASVGRRHAGVTSMHDATEGGVLNALYEISQTSNVGLRVDLSKIVIPPEVRAICTHFSLDPFTSVSLGTLILTARSEYADEIIRKLKMHAIAAWVIGEVVEHNNGAVAFYDGRKIDIDLPAPDPFWQLMAQGRELGWS